MHEIDMLKKLAEMKLSETEDNQPTFFSVIGRENDEDLISRVVAYVLESDTELVRKLIEHYAKTKKESIKTPLPGDLDNISSITVKPEKTTNYGRMDLFVIAKGAQRDVTITIENKIKTGEHETSNKQIQTEEYFDYISNQYNNCYNVFYYLTPETNESIPKSECFVKITYIELLDFISETQDPIITDFMRHARYYFGKEKVMLTERDFFLIEQYKNVMSQISDFEKQISKMKNEIADEINFEIEKKLGITIPEWPKGTNETMYYEKENWNGKIGLGSYRLYKPQWYEKGHYYFYVEICFDDGLLQNIYYQLTVKVYGTKNNNTMRNYFEKRALDLSFHPYYLFKRENSTCSAMSYGSSLEHPWNKSGLIEEAIDKLPVLLKEMDEVYKDYLSFASEN